MWIGKMNQVAGPNKNLKAYQDMDDHYFCINRTTCIGHLMEEELEEEEEDKSEDLSDLASYVTKS
jgi:hypothetical protein